MEDRRILAFAGKGGVGKTSLSAVTVLLLARLFPGKKILAIDADPAVGLATALGIEADRTVNDVRLRFVDEFTRPGRPSALEVMNEAHYEMIDAVVDAGDFAFLAIGRPEGAGCYCAVNEFLKGIVTGLAEEFDYVVIDGEAGIEQINRRVMEKVTDLILVSDGSKKGIDVVKTIDGVAKSLGMCNRSGLVINRVGRPEVRELICGTLEGGPELLGFTGEDEELAMLDIKGMSLAQLPEDSATVAAMKDILKKLGIFPAGE